jgi:glycerophosphoryl diester phosphodiesterase
MLPEAFRRAGRPAVLGHRGSPLACAENTLESFRAALAEGADGVELDVMRCASGELVVVHDPDLTRLAGQRLEVRKTSWSTLRGLDVGAALDPRFAGARLVLLPEVLESLPESALVNVELKGQDSAWAVDLGLAGAVARVLRGAASTNASKDRFLVSSFNPVLLLAFRRAAPEIAAAFLFGDSSAALRGAPLGRLLQVQALNPSVSRCSARSLRRWKAQGYGICVWTVDEPAAAIALSESGVDCVISNRPRVIREAFR